MKTIHPVKDYAGAAGMTAGMLLLAAGAAFFWLLARRKAFAAVEHGGKCFSGRFSCGASPEECLRRFENGVEAGLLRATLLRRDGRTFLEFRVLSARGRAIMGRKYLYEAAPSAGGKQALVLNISGSRALSHSVLKQFFAETLGTR